MANMEMVGCIYISIFFNVTSEGKKYIRGEKRKLILQHYNSIGETATHTGKMTIDMTNGPQNTMLLT
eukprot:8713918-Ditylum_brightwellii.AAC.1